MQLLDTTNEKYKHLCNQECNIKYRGFVLFIYFNHDTLKTSIVNRIERKDEIIEVFTKNSTYIFSAN